MSRHISELNNFDCLRLIAALMVLVSHSYPLTGRSYEPFLNWVGGYDTAGSMGVAIFFVISGFLVSGSVSRRSTMSYLASRALRIVPALALVSCFDVLLIGPAFTTGSLLGYFADASTWDHLANPLVFRINLYLPGVFESLPITGVNGSLWTLPCECGLYLILPAFAFCGGLTKRGSVLAFATCLVTYLVGTEYFGLQSNNQGPILLHGVSLYYALKLAAFFFAGAALWANREVVPLHTAGAIISVALLFAAAQTVTAPAVYFICVPYLVIFAALKTPVISLEKIGDLSYGIYVFAFPIQQGLVSSFGIGHIGPLRLSAVAIPIVLALAFLSWRFVEQPALRLRKRREAVVRTEPEAIRSSPSLVA